MDRSRKVSYSCAAAVRTALLSAGLVVGDRLVLWQPILISTRFQNYPVLPSLSQAEKEHLLTRAAIPYRDPKLSDSTEVMVMRRQQEQKISSLEPTSHWRKRWLLGTQSRDFMGGSL
ncbi:MAG: hypothetical protein V7K38_18560 [Nostoc sp.]